MPIVCDSCGCTADADEPPLSWSLSVERGQARRYCEPCTRRNLRALEGKLDVEHW